MQKKVVKLSSLSPFGRTVMVKTRHGTHEECFDWFDAVGDSLIMSGIAFFSSLETGIADGTGLTTNDLCIAGIAAFTAFFMLLAVKRKLIKR